MLGGEHITILVSSTVPAARMHFELNLLTVNQHNNHLFINQKFDWLLSVVYHYIFDDILISSFLQEEHYLRLIWLRKVYNWRILASAIARPFRMKLPKGRYSRRPYSYGCHPCVTSTWKYIIIRWWQLVSHIKDWDPWASCFSLIW